MSGSRFLLLYLGNGLDNGADGPWLRLRGGEVVARGTLAHITPSGDEADAPETVIGIVPGSEVAIHWVDLPDLAEAQAAAAARLLAAEVSAERLDNLHVALAAHRDGVDGSAAGDAGERIMGVVGADRMTAWIAQGQAAGFDPDALVPETLLLQPPVEGLVATESGPLLLVRGERQAFAVEPDLLPLLAADAPVARVSADEVEAGLGAVLATWPLDLRTGVFRKRRRWRIDWPLVRRLALLGALVFALNMLIQLTLIGKYNSDAARAEARTAAIARDALPRPTRITDPGAQLAGRLATLRGGGIGLSATLGGLFEALRAAPTVEVQALSFDPSGTLRATLASANAGDLGLVQTALTGRGLAVQPGDTRSAGGRQVVELRIGGS